MLQRHARVEVAVVDHERDATEDRHHVRGERHAEGKRIEKGPKFQRKESPMSVAKVRWMGRSGPFTITKKPTRRFALAARSGIVSFHMRDSGRKAEGIA